MKRLSAASLLLGAVLAVSGCTPAFVRSAAAPLPAEARESPDRFVVVTVRDAPESGRIPRASSTPRGYDAVPVYGPSASARALARDVGRDFELRPVTAWPIRVLDVHCVVFRLADEANAAATLAALSRDPRVESAQPLMSFSTLESRYNDAYRGLQHNLDELAVERAHAASRGAGVRLAIIDTGIDVSHPDLERSRVDVRDFTGGAGIAVERHGTEVAGVIAAITNNRRGIAGIAPAADVHGLKACWHPAAGTPAVCNTFTLAQALVAALELRAQVINLSLAGPSDPLLERLVARAIAAGAIVVAAVAPGDPPGRFPARLPGVLAVDSSEDGNTRADVLLAPGHEIPTLVPDGAYDFASGSSLAAAEVSATVALLLSARPTLTGVEARRILLYTSQLALASGAQRSIDACRAVAVVVATEDCTAKPARMALSPLPPP